MQPVPVEELPTPSVTLVQQATTIGEAYSFLATYYFGEAPAAAAVVLTTTPANAMSCDASAAGLGAWQFTCIPLEAYAAVVITANGPDPRDVNTRVQASTVVYNTSEFKMHDSCRAWDVYGVCKGRLCHAWFVPRVLQTVSTLKPDSAERQGSDCARLPWQGPGTPGMNIYQSKFKGTAGSLHCFERNSLR